jgi:hypothetical protein
MKKIALIVAALAIFASCDELSEFLAKDLSAIEGTYTGYTDATNPMLFEHYPTDGESFTITDNGNGTVDLLFESKVWGTYNIEGAQVAVALGVYGIVGEGKVNITMPNNPDQTAECEYALAATIKGENDANIIITLPSLMPQGTTVTFHTGEMPEELKPQKDEE